MKAKRIGVLGAVLITSMLLMMGCGERIGIDVSSGGGTGTGETTSEVVNEDNTAEETANTVEENEKENTGSEQQETESTSVEKSTNYIVIQGQDVYCDEQLLIDHSVEMQVDSIKDTIADFLEKAKENQCNVRLNTIEADSESELEIIVIDELKELGIDYEIEGE